MAETPSALKSFHSIRSCHFIFDSRAKSSVKIHDFTEAKGINSTYVFSCEDERGKFPLHLTNPRITRTEPARTLTDIRPSLQSLYHEISCGFSLIEYDLLEILQFKNGKYKMTDTIKTKLVYMPSFLAELEAILSQDEETITT